MLKALADRLAEAFAERLHERVRREFWGYAPDERSSNDAADRARDYRGIRPAPGYPAARITPRRRRCGSCSTSSDNAGIAAHRELRDVSRPPRSAAGTSRIPDAQYFAVGKIDLDQVQNYAARKKIALEEAQRWLAPILGYDPDSDADAA